MAHRIQDGRGAFDAHLAIRMRAWPSLILIDCFSWLL